MADQVAQCCSCAVARYVMLCQCGCRLRIPREQVTYRRFPRPSPLPRRRGSARLERRGVTPSILGREKRSCCYCSKQKTRGWNLFIGLQLDLDLHRITDTCLHPVCFIRENCFREKLLHNPRKFCASKIWRYTVYLHVYTHNEMPYAYQQYRCWRSEDLLHPHTLLLSN